MNINYERFDMEEESVPELEEDDLYSILTVSKDASNEDIIQAYRRLSKVYHPDKHSNPDDKRKADELFARLKNAYEVLTDPARRAVYNEVGLKGLDTEGNEIILRCQTAQEIQEEYQRINREREERDLERKTNPRGTVTVNLNATELFSPYLGSRGDDYYSESGPLVEFSGFNFSQSIEAPLTLKDTFVMSGAVNAQNGRGRGNISCGLRKTLTHKTWGEVEFGGSTSGFDFGLKGFSQLSPRYYFNFSALCQTGENEAKPALVMTLGSQLDVKSLGNLTWRMGSQNGVQTIYITETEKTRFSFCIHLGFPHSYASVQIAHKQQKDDNNKFRIGLRGGTFGAFLEYGVERKLSVVSSIGATIFIGVPLGINLRFKVVRSHQTYLFPIQLADDIVPAAIFYGTAAPFLLWMITKKLFMEPFEKEKLLREKEKKKMTNRTRMQAKRTEAESAKLLMSETYKRVKGEEEKRSGLIITRALYGRLITPDTERIEGEECIDVTIPLQCMVKLSILTLHNGSKNSLPGFYDPAVGEDKNLMIRYKFKNHLHEVVIRDVEHVTLPKQAHRVDPL